jgi:hypothetical protein
MQQIARKYFLFILLFLGCHRAEKKDVADWQKLTLISERNTYIRIENGTDTSIVNVYHIGSFFNPLPKGAKVKVDTFKVYFTKDEKDTIFSLTRDLIVNPINAHHFCTEYVGSLQLYIYFNEQLEQRVFYSSVCDWTRLSDKTIRLHNILRNRIKNVFLGEGGGAVSHVSN